MRLLTFLVGIVFCLVGQTWAGDIDRAINQSLTSNRPHILTLASASLPGGDASALGRGFSTLGDDWRGDCIEFDPNDAKPPVESVTTNFQIEIIDTVDKFTSLMSMSASASMSFGIYSGNVAASYLKRLVENSYSNYIAGKVTVFSQAANISPRGLSRLGQKALAAGVDIFHRTCGNQFATSVVYGGEFVFMLEVQSRDSSEYEAMKLDLQASVGNFGSASVSFAKSMERVSERYSLKTTILRNGLRENIPDQTPAAIQKYATEFPAKVTANEGIGMQPIRYGTRAYTSVEPNAPTVTEANIFFSHLTAQYLNAAAIAGQISYWQTNPDQFFFTDKRAQLEANRNAAIATMSILSDTALRCADKPSANCKFSPDLPKLDNSAIPKRLIWVKLPVSDNRRVSLGVVPSGETRRVRFRGLWSPSGGVHWWQPPEGSWYVHITSPEGMERTFRSPTSEVAKSRERVEVHLEDEPYSDNFEYPSNPASAALY